jgi:hypothetical protein
VNEPLALKPEINRNMTASSAATKESLKPAEVIVLQNRLGLKSKQRYTRHNPAFCRQGEWFFVPAP